MDCPRTAAPGPGTGNAPAHTTADHSSVTRPDDPGDPRVAAHPGGGQQRDHPSVPAAAARMSTRSITGARAAPMTGNETPEAAAGAGHRERPAAQDGRPQLPHAPTQKTPPVAAATGREPRAPVARAPPRSRHSRLGCRSARQATNDHRDRRSGPASHATRDHDPHTTTTGPPITPPTATSGPRHKRLRAGDHPHPPRHRRPRPAVTSTRYDTNGRAGGHLLRRPAAHFRAIRATGHRSTHLRAGDIERDTPLRNGRATTTTLAAGHPACNLDPREATGGRRSPPQRHLRRMRRASGASPPDQRPTTPRPGPPITPASTSDTNGPGHRSSSPAPATSGQRPAASHQRPATSGQPPAASDTTTRATDQPKLRPAPPNQ